MKTQYPDRFSPPRCQDINRQVELAESHQQMYYRDEPVRLMKKEPSIVSGAYQRLLALAIRWHTLISPRPSPQIGQPVQHPQ